LTGCKLISKIGKFIVSFASLIRFFYGKLSIKKANPYEDIKNKNADILSENPS